MKIQYLGHASFLIETNGKNIVIDPYITANPLAKHVNINQIHTEYLLITHAHNDHILDVETLAKNSNSVVISNYEIVNYFEKKGLKGHPMNMGGSWSFDFGKIHMVNALHSSSFPDGSYGGNPAGYVLEAEGKLVYIAGDSALTYDMKLIPELIGKIDIALLPLGDNFTMGINSAVKAAEFVQTNKVIASHFDTFGYIKIDHQQAISSFRNSGKELILLKIGETYSI